MHWYNKHKSELSIGDCLADRVTTWTGSFTAFLISLLIVIVWGITGPYFQYSDTWQLVINTSTTIVTFLMVFLIQNNQNRQESRDRHQAEVDYQTTLAAKQEIEDLQQLLSRIEVEKLDHIHDLTINQAAVMRLILDTLAEKEAAEMGVHDKLNMMMKRLDRLQGPQEHPRAKKTGPA